MSSMFLVRTNLIDCYFDNGPGPMTQDLERLLQNEEDMAKIRTLDLEVHFNMDANPEGNYPIKKENLMQHVIIMEKLADKFAVTGSSLETYLQKTIKNYKAYGHANPGEKRDAVPHVYTKGGVNLDQYT